MPMLRITPAPPVAFQQRVGLTRPPTPRRVLRNRGGFGGAPNVQDRIDQGPGGFDAVAAIEQRGVAAHAIA